jgi:Asp/Glu/hydantoin racemase
VNSANAPIRIWFQSYVDATLGGPYLDHLRTHLDRIRDANTELALHGMTPPDSYAHPLMEFRCARLAIQNAIRAEREGFDAVAFGHMQDSGLWEARAAVGIPVLSLGETSMLHACMLGARSGIVTINPRFIPGFIQQVARYGLQQRVTQILSVDHQPGEFMRSFESPADARKVIGEFVAQAERLIAGGVDVLIPGGGIPMLLLAEARIRSIGGAPVVDGLHVLLKQTELAVILRRESGIETSRLADFRLPPAEVIQEFLDN